ncbi:acid phosphatase [Echria macrotheca]|uniref:Acid phosphatase n=1 Tax=Echria macrotheca TaxID=438768 RepID=A0AAJ0B996_9PEZI|nr:acid phosphatase [Echria macrotheca]
MLPRCVLVAWAALATASYGLNILMTNEDGFAAANIRELYKQLTGLGHNCYIVAPATDQSTDPSRTLFSTDSKLTTDSEWDILKAGAPAIGTDPQDDHIWYYNGTPAAQVLVALDYVLPNFAKFQVPDLVISGPNSGWTLGPFVYTLAGSIGATIAAMERGIPAISLSSGNTDSIPFTWVNASTKVGLDDPATITARLATSLIQAMVDKAKGSPILPRGYGVSVNMPFITSYSSDKCTNPPFILTRMAPSTSDRAVYDKTTGLFHSSPDASATSENSHGDDLPAERDVVASSCMSSVTVFALEFDPSFHGMCVNISDVTALVPLIVQVNGSIVPDGPGNGTVVVVGNSSQPSKPDGDAPAPPPMTTITGMGAKTQMSLSALLLGAGVVAALL